MFHPIRRHAAHLLVSALLLTLPCWPAQAQTVDLDHDPYGPQRARAVTASAISADDIDSVSPFNGGLALAIPIGQAYPAGGSLRYQFVAHYSSQVEDVRLRRGPQPDEEQVMDYHVRLPNAGSTAGLGWSLHLGRLIEPIGDRKYNAQTPEWRERRPRPGYPNEGVNVPASGWRYFAPDDGVTEFHDQLRTEPAQAGVLYARDGSFKRLQLLAPGASHARLGTCPSANGVLQCAFLELANGEVHRFEKRDNWPDAKYQPDPWRLREIRDRGDGSANWNGIDVSYFADRWQVTDQYGRSHSLYWEADPNLPGAPGWYYGRIREVRLKAFGGTTATWQFSYENRSFQRISDDGHSRQTRTLGVLAAIVRPDGLRYEVAPPAGAYFGTPISNVRTPAGAQLSWQYTQVELPSVTQCSDGAPSTGGAPQNFVQRRQLKDAGGTTLADTWYLWGQYAGAGLPTQYCFNDGFLIAPAAEHVGGVFQRYQNGRSRLTLNYFSVWPFARHVTDDGASGTLFTPAQAANWGWKGEDYGQPFTRNQVDAGSGALLSSQVYDCALDTPSQLDPRALAGSCTRLRSTYLQREGVRHYVSPCPGGCTPNWLAQRAQEPAGAGLAQTRREVTVFHDNGDTRIDDVYSDNDGFGHYRTQRSSGTVGPDQTRETTHGYNNTRGTLVLDGNGLPASGSTWSNVPASDGWVLGNSSREVVRELEGSTWRTVSQRLSCFVPHTALLKRARTRKNPDADSREDLVQVYQYSYSLPQSSLFYGGDLLPLPAASVGQGCDYAFEGATAPHVLNHHYEYGVLQTSRQNGSSTWLVDHRNRNGGIGIDASTGLITASRDPSGTLLTETTYDLMGRPERITRSGNNGGTSFDRTDVGPDEEFSYFLPGYKAPPGWEANTLPLVLARRYKGTATLDQSATLYDVSGREIRQDRLHPESGWLRTDTRYGPDGQQVFRSTPQPAGAFNPNFGTSSSHDAFGRVLMETAADGELTRYTYVGIQQTDISRRVGAIDTGSGVQSRGSIRSYRYDRYGNLLQLQEPLSSTAPVSIDALCSDPRTTCKTTVYRHDALDREVAAVRGVQSRLRAFDGRGFLSWERLPELGGGSAACSQAGAGCKLYTHYNSLGLAGRSTDGTSVLQYTYDAAGRLQRIQDGSNAVLLSNFWGSSGLQNGRLVRAERSNFVTRENSGGAGEAAPANTIYGNRRVRHEYGFHASGEPSSRRIQVHYVPDGSPEHLMAQFDQSWNYDSAGRLRQIVYPVCSRPGCTNNGTARSVDIGYGAGDRTLAISTTDDLGASLAYHDNGQLQRLTHHGNNGRTDWFGIGPNRLPRLSSLKLATASSSNPAATALLDLGTHSYDGAGNLVQIGANRFVHDLDSRLVKSYVGGFWGSFQSYSYDQYENLLAATPDSFTVDPATNRLQGSDLNHDGSGRISRVGAFSLFHDALGRQQSMVQNDAGVSNPCVLNNVTGRCWLYWYGPDGERVGGISLLPNGAGNYFWTIRDLQGRVLRRFDSINELITPREDLIHAGQLLIGSRDFVTGSVRHHHTDHLGSVRLSTDALTGAAAGQSRYSPYGRSDINQSGLLTTGWAGYENDPNNLTHNLHARTYFSVWGRFFTPDPARDGWNLYSYSRNNPVSLYDPSGLQTETPCKDPGQEANGTAAAANSGCGKATPVLSEKDKAVTARGGISEATGKLVVAEARTWIGTPYRSGGGENATKGAGADCSGAVCAIFKAVGLPYPYRQARDFHAEALQGRLPFAQVQFPQGGDVVVFSGHLAIYAPGANPDNPRHDMLNAFHPKRNFGWADSRYWGSAVLGYFRYLKPPEERPKP